MKKILILLIAFAISTAAFAQKGLDLGVHVVPQSIWILNKSDFDLGPILDHRPSWGMAFGLTAGYNFTNNLGIHSGFFYSAQGQGYEGSILPEFGSELTYLKIPILFKINSNPDAGAHFIFTVGPQFGLLTGHNYTENGLSLDEVKEAYNSMDIGITFSFGTRIRLVQNLFLGLALRFDSSITDMEDKDFTSWATGRASSYNATGGLQVGLNYVLGGG